ncbi:nitrilase family protein [Desulforamulus hydrothermalis]|uniref:Nitrilase/cyanide hydratase and apolipoprotein N-acyltransferase n=1 Tax=Desulforamulus hydrothermalis Lam5 = DSM 18033 TaxID=1121428 RepID=K8E685_9FIRM|nr:nitrilase family protein [Desulforamulus hydrothermalis]CCO06963.1 Nitrilase/cyanide hydratase and apolipoprotein N-acyltransferase [Desulforamulus hydrothermalis Lam5 = DSM 18033]SHG98686.1 Predicted amidohydrolase [Desulforamulus hydrothermalis Lam5 = DSM 18033]
MLDTRIGLVQMQAKVGRLNDNLAVMGRFVEEAAAQAVDIICFPEMCLQGYHREKAGEFAQDITSSAFVTSLEQMAKLNNITVIAGMAERNGEAKPFITQIVVYPDGTVDKYRKTHLGKSEQPYFSAGDDIKVFATAKAKFGIQICWDTHFPELATILSLRGCEIIFAPHASPSFVGDRRDIWLKYLPARAYDNTVFIGACNLVGEDGQGRIFCGGALILDPKGNIVAEDFRGEASLLVADLAGSKINTIRQQQAGSMANSFYLRARRPELYQELVKGQTGLNTG